MRWIYLVIAGGVFTLDQVTKALVRLMIPLHDGYTVIPGLFTLTHVRNRGAAFGMFSDSPLVRLEMLIALSAVALVVVAALLWRNHVGALLAGVGLSLILGGALGNLFDRIVHGSVVDFLEFGVRGYHWPSFNVADSAIVIGAGLLVLDMVRKPAPTAERS